ncbi:DUF4440 domain-containing protein [Pelomonas sp. SE-A7]|uniref:YybH family protein n=1 Tax=Pelomonas sp. SE-A7 TaxID=3054953 RepID=UPI00259CE9A0|nr:DUF4440 domain-containing protein [Pelomonas sp. SE-A7]MDM4764978.1 DUF4440 domain-containing protein [Pelomonas sp. SE-A7]
MQRLLASLVLLALLSACATAPYEGSPRQADDHRQLKAALDASVAGWNEGDLRRHLGLYDESITFMTKQGPRPGIAPIETAFRAKYFNGDKPKQALRMEQVTIRSLSSDSALMNGRFVLSGGGEAEQSGWFSLVWLRMKDGSWKAVHDHSS